MRSMIVIGLTLLSLLAGGCKEKTVFQPIPYTYVFSFNMLPQGSTAFADSSTLSGAEIRQAIVEQLDGDFSLEEITQNNVESLAYVLIDTDQTHAIINGDFRIRYANGAAADLIDLEDVVLGEILGVPQSVSLTDQNIAIVQQAVDEIIAGSSISNITVSGAGSTSHLVNRFIIEVRLTITHVVEQKVEIFDPF